MKTNTAFRLGLMVTSMLAPAGAWAQETSASTAGNTGAATANAEEQTGVEEIVVTAQKRSENLQKVPISITAIGTEKLEQLKVKSVEDYVKFLPAVSFTSTGPGSTHAFFRGVSSGEGSNHSASLPTVGVYLDEQPITTIQGELELHVYDLARVEALSGPQGTLYGASSEAGTIRLITNKPKLGTTEAALDLEANTLAHGDPGGVAEGFINLPVGDNAAIRLVGWYEHDGGYIDNVPTTLTFPNSGITKNNAGVVEKNYNEVDTYGGRATLRLELGDRWVVTPTIMAQQQKSDGLFAYDKTLGKLKVGHFFPENANDRWAQAALTIEGKLGSVDVTYTGSYLNRKFDSNSDYTDYSYFYDVISGYTLQNDAGDNIDPSQYIYGRDRFTKLSQELRLATDIDNPFRVVGGLFYQRQRHNIEQNYQVNDLAAAYTVPGTVNDLWLTKQKRVDRDYALFGEASYDVSDQLTVTAGGRWFKYDNTLIGFYGFNEGYSSSQGTATCFGPATVKGGPCTDLGVLNADGSISPRRAKKTDFTQRVNVTYKIDPRRLVYATWSRGFRPGGINRRGSLAPYEPDYLDNYEVGFKTSWLDNKLRINGAAYYLDWKGVQFSFLGANGLTEIQNAGDAHIKGFEYDIQFVPTPGLTISTAGSFNDAKLADNFCRIDNSPDCSLPDAVTGKSNEVLAPKGRRLPTSAKFKGTTTVRYEQPVGSGGYTGHIQTSLTYQTNSRNSLRTGDLSVFGTRPGYVLVDANIGVANDVWSFELFGTNIFDRVADVYRYSECGSATCGGRPYAFVTRPRKIGIRVGRKF